ncbi:MAG: demethoxyubiquinone hydroxylase family protein [Methylotenera sp. 17-45-7]|nr:MAG: demethoxyubiquinone hydroxylase family protein [Methylotenera sp. 17-45-7]
MRHNTIDKIICEFDTGLRTLLAKPHSLRPHPDQDIAEASLSESEKKHASALMRINHTGEVCAQALLEETEHLAWCEARIQALGGHTSFLNPLFYAGSFAIGAIAGALGDKWSLGFVEETEKQVGAHLDSHLRTLPDADEKSRKIIEQMRLDEAKHAIDAKQQGAANLPAPVKFCMKQMSKLMTSSTYHL